MMLAGGTGRGERILSPATVALMTTDRLTSSQRDASALFLGEHSLLATYDVHIRAPRKPENVNGG